MKNQYQSLLVYRVMVFFVLLCLFSCNGFKYLQEVPYKFKYDIPDIKKNYGVDDNSLLTESNEYTSVLTDKEIYLKEKYSIILNVEPSQINNYKFYDVIDEWIGKNHKVVGADETSISMGALAQLIYQEAFDKKLPPAPIDIFNSPDIELFLGRKFLKEGDLIFFRYNKDNPVSDIGIYLKNDLILASTPSNGIAIFDFDVSYFQIRYLCAGRAKTTEK